MGRPGRKLLLVIQPSLLDEVCGLLAKGCAVKTVCQATGLSESSFHRWSDAGNPESPEYDPRFSEFLQRTTRARGEGKVRLIELITKHARTDGRLALELLRSIAPGEYAPRSTRRDGNANDDEPVPDPALRELHVRVTRSYERHGYRIQRADADE